jgi:hypothetical protein
VLASILLGGFAVTLVLRAVASVAPIAAPFGVAALHGALLVTAIGWAAHDGGWDPRPLQAAIVLCLLVAACLTAADRRAGIAYLGLGAVLAVAAASGRLEPLGVRAVSARWVAVGVALGAVLGGHLLLSASRTVSFRVREDGVILYAAAFAYDIGANVPSAEGFFRGALFNRLQRRRTFAAAASSATAACIARYVADPVLPAGVDAMAGAIFYILVLSVVTAWLLWRTGSLLPGIAAALAFFAAWRLLAAT